MEQIFSGLKVIDCASFIAAPAAATILSDFGADVIKIEPPGIGCGLRRLHSGPAAPISDKDYGWMMDSRNKRSIALDLKSPDGLEVLHKLVDTADVFITNMPLDARRRMKITYEDLGPRNDRMIYGSFTAYGETGPEAEKSGFDSTAYWARSGLMDLVRYSGSPPARSVAGLGDHPCGMNMFAGIVLALYRRQITGKGGLVSSSLLAGGMWANSYSAQAELVGAKFQPREGRDTADNPISNIYRAKCGRWFALAMVSEAKQYPLLVKALGHPALADPKFTTPKGRKEHKLELIGLLDSIFIEHDLAYWRSHLDKAGITFGVIGKLSDIHDDVQMHATEVLVPFADGSGETISNPINLDGEIKTPPRMAPNIGEHTDEILREAGFDAAAIGKLRESKAVA